MDLADPFQWPGYPIDRFCPVHLPDLPTGRLLAHLPRWTQAKRRIEVNAQALGKRAPRQDGTSAKPFGLFRPGAQRHLKIALARPIVGDLLLMSMVMAGTGFVGVMDQVFVGQMLMHLLVTAPVQEMREANQADTNDGERNVPLANQVMPGANRHEAKADGGDAHKLCAAMGAFDTKPESEKTERQGKQEKAEMNGRVFQKVRAENWQDTDHERHGQAVKKTQERKAHGRAVDPLLSFCAHIGLQVNSHRAALETGPRPRVAITNGPWQGRESSVECRPSGPKKT